MLHGEDAERRPALPGSPDDLVDALDVGVDEGAALRGERGVRAAGDAGQQ
ncbi:hypothetical protein [Nocardioides convexus]|nr:hypothetical protein [Nocardioides convexus]